VHILSQIQHVHHSPKLQSQYLEKDDKKFYKFGDKHIDHLVLLLFSVFFFLVGGVKIIFGVGVFFFFGGGGYFLIQGYSVPGKSDPGKVFGRLWKSFWEI